MSARIITANLERQADGIRATAERNARASTGSTGCTLSATVYVDGGLTRVPRKMRKGSGSPKLCWMCGKQLQRAPGKGLGLFYFNLVADRAGVEHRVHGDCTSHAIGDGCKVMPEVAA